MKKVLLSLLAAASLTSCAGGALVSGGAAFAIRASEANALTAEAEHALIQRLESRQNNAIKE